jgi:RimJ/RimL family protein N-acetyltransferase
MSSPPAHLSDTHQKPRADAILLRLPLSTDLESLYEQQADPQCAAMAMVHPRTRNAFTAHFTAVCANPEVTMFIIMFGNITLGSINSFPTPEGRAVGYTIAREYWGKGIATRAMSLFLARFPTRPLRADVARTNIGSARVLERNGFICTGYSHEPATDRYIACEVAHYLLT